MLEQQGCLFILNISPTQMIGIALANAIKAGYREWYSTTMLLFWQGLQTVLKLPEGTGTSTVSWTKNHQRRVEKSTFQGPLRHKLVHIHFEIFYQLQHHSLNILVRLNLCECVHGNKN